jgi:predicted ATPase
MITKERVHKKGKEVLCRPNSQDERDPIRLTQTFLEQVSVNQEFRELAEFFASVQYLHVIPQVVRSLLLPIASESPYGGGVLRQMADLPEDERQKRLQLIRGALRSAVPQLKELEFWFDQAEKRPHLRAKYEHLHGTWQLEDQFSDGTLRLIGSLWALLDGGGPLLLEEPELSLHPEVVRHLPQMFATIQNRTGRQVMISTHSEDLLRDEGIAPDEVLLLQPGPEGTVCRPADDVREVRALLESGLTLAETVLPQTAPRAAYEMMLLKD